MELTLVRPMAEIPASLLELSRPPLATPTMGMSLTVEVPAVPGEVEVEEEDTALADRSAEAMAMEGPRAALAEAERSEPQRLNSELLDGDSTFEMTHAP